MAMWSATFCHASLSWASLTPTLELERDRVNLLGRALGSFGRQRVSTLPQRGADFDMRFARLLGGDDIPPGDRADGAVHGLVVDAPLDHPRPGAVGRDANSETGYRGASVDDAAFPGCGSGSALARVSVIFLVVVDMPR
jgi:hypothetical protein